MASSFEGGNLSQLFATPVWTFKPIAGRELAERLSQLLYALRAADPRWPFPDGRTFWQSRDDLHQAPGFEPLVALVNEAARASVSLLQMACELKVTGLWGNIGSGAETLHEHTHPNNYLSGVFYARMPPGAGSIVFKDPRPQSRILRPRVVKDAPLNSLEFEYAAAEGALLLFPAWLEHGVAPGKNAEDRITVAFNLMITGPLGSRETLAYSEIG